MYEGDVCIRFVGTTSGHLYYWGGLYSVVERLGSYSFFSGLKYMQVIKYTYLSFICYLPSLSIKINCTM